jgi:hypothetical protein
MQPPFDIFRVGPDGHPIWLEAAATLDAANARINALGKSSPGEFLIYSQRTGNKISITVDRKGLSEKGE